MRFERDGFWFYTVSLWVALSAGQPLERSEMVEAGISAAQSDEGRYLADRLWVALEMEQFYDSMTALRFCFNFDSPYELLDIFREILPADEGLFTANDTGMTTDGGICGDWSNTVQHICKDEQDYILYFQFILQTDNPEKIPDTNKCSSANSSTADGGCLPGFFETEEKAHKCCDGFFCPSMLNCMIPCPLGAYCPRAYSVDVPNDMLKGLDTDIREEICAPYGYEKHEDVGCGGAGNWDLDPRPPFFPVPGCKGHIYCPSGHYCEDTWSPPELCRASLPKDYFGLAFDVFMFVLLALAWQASRYYNRLLRRLSARERIRIRWGVHPTCDIVPPAAHGAASAMPQSESAISAGGPGASPSNSVLPRLMAVRTLSSMLSRTFSHPSEILETRGVPIPEPAVWASLPEEVSPSTGAPGEEDDRGLRTSHDHLIEDLNFTAVTIEFCALSLKVKSCGKLVVSEASGKLESSRLTVVMGPSGCGKTSLLSFLACQADYVMTTGTILINGVKSTLRRYRKVTGFVPQDDIIHPILTVEENLLFSARFRLTRHMKRHDILAVVDRAIRLLGLVEVRNQLVGNEESRGISGGQRKRVNIGLELVADPWILFLDEPTSGLDATSCTQVLSALAKIAHMGVTCAAVVHQPSNRVMKMFDDVLLLGRNARTVYYGPQTAIKSYFLALGFQFPADENPADVYLDIVVRPKAAPVSPRQSLSEIWETSAYRARYLTQGHFDAEMSPTGNGLSNDQGGETLLEDTGFIARIKNTIWMGLYLVLSPFCLAIDNMVTALRSLSGARRAGYTAFSSEGGQDEELRITPRIHTQFLLCVNRCILERTRSAFRIFLEYALYAMLGMILGILSDARSSGRLKSFVTDMNFHIVAVALMTTVGSLRTFTENHLVFLRESKAGLNKLAHCCAIALFGDVGSVLKGLCYLSLYYSYAQPRALFGDLLLVTSALIYSCCGFGYLISKMLKPGPAQLTAAVFVLSNALLSRGRGGTLISFIRSLLYHRWALEAYTISEAKQLFGVWTLERCGTLHFLNYDIRHFPFAVIVLVLLGLGTRVLSFGIIIGVGDTSD